MDINNTVHPSTTQFPAVPCLLHKVHSIQAQLLQDSDWSNFLGKLRRERLLQFPRSHVKHIISCLHHPHCFPSPSLALLIYVDLPEGGDQTFP